MWVLIGGVLLVAFIPPVFDSAATINYNGKHTAAFGPKISVVIFLGCFVAAGLFFLLVPSRLFDRFMGEHSTNGSTI
jgi:hypothetical protein